MTVQINLQGGLEEDQSPHKVVDPTAVVESAQTDSKDVKLEKESPNSGD